MVYVMGPKLLMDATWTIFSINLLPVIVMIPTIYDAYEMYRLDATAKADVLDSTDALANASAVATTDTLFIMARCFWMC
jgi:hypothetical protein